MVKKAKHRYIIGIDCGVNTGFAVYDRKEKKLDFVLSMPIHSAFDQLNHIFFTWSEPVFVRVEDARKRKWFGNAGREKLQGAGSVKRDAKIWEDFLTDLGIPFEMVAPKNNKTKLTAELFKKITSWKDKTNEHSRDAAMLCFGF